MEEPGTGLLMVLVTVGMLLALLGLLLIVLGVIGGSRSSRVEAGGVVIIGPFPILFGSRRLAEKALWVAIALVVFAYLAWWLVWLGRSG